MLMFRDAALRRPNDAVAFVNAADPLAVGGVEASDNVLSLARFAHRRRASTWSWGPPDGEAA